MDNKVLSIKLRRTVDPGDEDPVDVAAGVGIRDTDHAGIGEADPSDGKTSLQNRSAIAVKTNILIAELKNIAKRNGRLERNKTNRCIIFVCSDDIAGAAARAGAAAVVDKEVLKQRCGGTVLL